MSTVAEDRKKGTVKWFNSSKGYGFIGIDGERKDIFVHYSAINSNGYKSLNEGDKVEFNLETTPKGLQAQDVVVVTD